MILQVGIPLFLTLMLGIALSLVVVPSKFFNFLSSIYGYNMQPRVPPWRLRLIGVVQSIIVSGMLFLWWSSRGSVTKQLPRLGTD
jgi:hypothetical protein